MATPRVCGRTPFQRLRPALPIVTSSCSLLPTSPTVARQSISTRRISVRGQTQRGELAFLGDQLHGDTGRTGHLAAATGAQLDVVDRGTDRDVAQRQGVARLDVGAVTAADVVADVEALGGQDVGLLAVGVVQQGDAAGAVGVVLDGRDLGGDAVLDALEVDHAVRTLVAATAVT